MSNINEKDLNKIKDSKWVVLESLIHELEDWDMDAICQLLNNANVDSIHASNVKSELIEDLKELQKNNITK